MHRYVIRVLLTAKPGNSLSGLGKLWATRTEDWVQSDADDIYSTEGQSYHSYYQASPSKALADHLCQITIGLHGTFVNIPRGFWKDVQNRRNFMDWVGKQLGYGH